MRTMLRELGLLHMHGWIEIIGEEETFKIQILQDGVVKVWMQCTNLIHYLACMKIMIPRRDNRQVKVDWNIVKPAVERIHL